MDSIHLGGRKTSDPSRQLGLLVANRLEPADTSDRRTSALLLDGKVLQARENGAEIFTHRNLQSAARFNDRDDGGHPRTRLLASDVDPILPVKESFP
jgi:hypothetical protein